jgi:hypothetical protein
MINIGQIGLTVRFRQKRGGAKGAAPPLGGLGIVLRNYLILMDASEPGVLLPVPAISFSK